MGNWWRGVSSEKLRECETNLMRINGIAEGDYIIRDVHIDGDSTSQNYIHEISVRGLKEDLPVLVMVHGYMSGGMQYCKMMPYLRNYFNVIAIDLLGMGASGRPQNLNMTTFENTMDFFMDSIHLWTQIKGVGQNGKKFYLLGHSLGGLICGHYALEHQEQVQGLILMSSVGVQEKPATLQRDRFIADRESAASRYGAEWFIDTWPRLTFSPADTYRCLGYRVAKYAVKSGILRRFREGVFTDEEKEYFMEWVVQIGMRRKSSEVCVFQLLAILAYSAQPLCHKLHKLNMPVAFMYGEYDWVSREVADKLIADGKVQGQVFATSESGHHLYAEAAVECVSALLKFTYGEQVQNDFICSI